MLRCRSLRHHLAQSPVAAFADRQVGTYLDDVSRPHLAHTPKHGHRRGNICQREIRLERLARRRSIECFGGKERLDLRRKTHTLRAGVVMQRLLAEAVAREEHAARRRVPQRERDHPIRRA